MYVEWVTDARNGDLAGVAATHLDPAAPYGRTDPALAAAGPGLVNDG